MSFTLHGLPISGGIAIGQAHLISQATLDVSHLVIPVRAVDREIARFDTALERVRHELTAIKAGLESSPTDIGAFIDLHLMILSDPELCEEPKQIIRERRCNAEWAIVQKMEGLVAQFEKIDDIYLRERSYDVRQVVERVVRELAGRGDHPLSKVPPRGTKSEVMILVAHDLSPSDVMAFKEHNFASFVTDVGGATSHTAILARGMGIPAVLGLHNARQLIHDKETLIVDGTRGVVIVNPDKRVLEEYQLKKSQFEIERSKLKLLKTARATTLDKVKIELLANIEEPSDIAAAMESGAEGIGLFRTEFIFLGRGDMPSEDEQFEAYRKVIKGMDGKPVTIRTFDLGNDKNIQEEGLEERRRDNPALGLRSIRLSLSEPKSFQTQLRAILRASKYGKVKILIPMLSHAQQVDQTLAALEQAKSSLRGEKIGFDETIEIGGMIEVPAAALAIGVFLRRLDFISIGTNDLIQYTLAIDRTDEQVANLYDPLHPAVLMLLAHIISSAEKANVPVSMCGELAGDPTLTRLLLGMGLRQFSMFPAQIPAVKQRIKQSDITELTPIVRRILRLEECGKIQEQIDRLNLL